MNIRKKQKKL